MMRSWRIATLVALLLAVPALVAWNTAPEVPVDDSATITLDGEDGPALFKEAGCTKCHSVTAKNIARTEEADPEEECQSGDLSTVGTKGYTAENLSAYLIKRGTLAGLNCGKHKKKYRGTPEQLATLVTWLLSLK